MAGAAKLIAYFEKHRAGDLLALSGSEGPLLWELFDLYVATTPKIIDAMQWAFQKGDVRALAMQAHSLKSSSATLGFIEMQKFCERIEAGPMQMIAALDISLVTYLRRIFYMSVQEFERFARETKAVA